jgi:zinc protease
MFKGSKHFPLKKGKSALDTLSEKGALVNATTWLDRTNYYEVLPREHLDFALRLEADRMRNAVITDAHLIEEMPAVRSEYAKGENDPLEALDKHIWASAYVAHPYHHSTIGWLSDIEQVPVSRLQEFYDTFYWPNNAVLSVVGDFNKKETLSLIARYFGVHRRSPHSIPEPYTQEPQQLGKRFVEVNRAGTQRIVGLAYKVPEALHPDTPALIALNGVLSSGTTSRLHKALVDTSVAASVQSFYVPLKDPSLMITYVTLHEHTSHEEVTTRLRRELRKVRTKGVTKRELRRVLRSIQTDMARARDGHYAMLSSLNEAIAVGDWKYYFDMPKKLEKVRPLDVQRAAQTYFVETQETLGYYQTRIL